MSKNENIDNNINNTAADATDNAQISTDVEAFYRRADAIIELANSQLGPDSHSGQVGASLMYASARYSASVASIGFTKGEDFALEKEQIVEFYSKQFKQMLSDNVDDYAKNFEKYVQFNKEKK